MDTNAAGSSRGGASAEKIAAVSMWRDSELFDEPERAALALAEAMSATPAEVTDAIFDAVPGPLHRRPDRRARRLDRDGELPGAIQPRVRYRVHPHI